MADRPSTWRLGTASFAATRTLVAAGGDATFCAQGNTLSPLNVPAQIKESELFKGLARHDVDLQHVRLYVLIFITFEVFDCSPESVVLCNVYGSSMAVVSYPLG